MRNSIRLLLTLVMLVPIARPAELSDFIGIWKGMIGSLPAVTLTLEQEEGKPTGAILFYLIRRHEDGKQTASAGVPEPLIEPKLDGKVLTFKVSHKHAHPPRTLNDPPVEFKLEWEGPGTAVLTGREAPPCKMIRSN